ncbi:MAG: hypothetical protein K1X36_14585, partial [Pyrinomonadaceae bacterium]|nr:hypothetical protein [Pyrinomonadaceae bacterium]
GGTPGVFWRHEDPLTSSYRKIDASGNEGGSLADSPANVEYDPLGGAIPTIDLDATAFPVTVQFPKTIPRISSRNTGKMVIGHSIVYSRPLLESAMTAACEPIFLFILVVKM